MRCRAFAIILVCSLSLVTSFDQTFSQTGVGEIKRVQKDSIVLSTEKPTAILKPDFAGLRSIPEILELRLTVPQDTTLASFHVVVFLNSNGQKEVSVGSFAPYPVKSGGKFLLRIDRAFKQLQMLDKNATLDNLSLRFELRQERQIEKVSVLIDSLKWMTESKQKR